MAFIVQANAEGTDAASFAVLDREEAFDIARRWIKNVLSASKSSVTAAFTSRPTSKGRLRLTRVNCCSAYQPISAARPLALAMDSPIYWRVRGLQIAGASMPPLPLRSMRPEQLSPSGVHHLRGPSLDYYCAHFEFASSPQWEDFAISPTARKASVQKDTYGSLGIRPPK